MGLGATVRHNWPMPQHGRMGHWRSSAPGTHWGEPNSTSLTSLTSTSTTVPNMLGEHPIKATTRSPLPTLPPSRPTALLQPFRPPRRPPLPSIGSAATAVRLPTTAAAPPRPHPSTTSILPRAVPALATSASFRKAPPASGTGSTRVRRVGSSLACSTLTLPGTAGPETTRPQASLVRRHSRVSLRKRTTTCCSPRSATTCLSSTELVQRRGGLPLRSASKGGSHWAALFLSHSADFAVKLHAMNALAPVQASFVRAFNQNPTPL